MNGYRLAAGAMSAFIFACKAFFWIVVAGFFVALAVAAWRDARAMGLVQAALVLLAVVGATLAAVGVIVGWYCLHDWLERKAEETRRTAQVRVAEPKA